MKKILPIIISVVAIIFGIVAIVNGVKTISERDLYDSTVTATVVDVQEEIDSSDPENAQTNTTVYIDYEIDGTKYEHVEAPEYDSGMQVGDTMEILYQSKNPEKISGQNPSKNGIIFCALGAVFAIVGCVSAIRSFIKR